MTPQELKAVVTEYASRVSCSDKLYAADCGGYDTTDEMMITFDEAGALLHLIERVSTPPQIVNNAWQREKFTINRGVFRLVPADVQPEQPSAIGEEILGSREVIRNMEGYRIPDDHVEAAE